MNFRASWVSRNDTACCISRVANNRVAASSRCRSASRSPHMPEDGRICETLGVAGVKNDVVSLAGEGSHGGEAKARGRPRDEDQRHVQASIGLDGLGNCSGLVAADAGNGLVSMGSPVLWAVSGAFGCWRQLFNMRGGISSAGFCAWGARSCEPNSGAATQLASRANFSAEEVPSCALKVVMDRPGSPGISNTS